METLVIKDLRRFLTGGDVEDLTMTESSSFDATTAPTFSTNLTENTQVALPVAAMKTLLGVIQRTQSETMMGLQMELKQASEEMIQFINDERNYFLLGGRSHIAMASGCELFMKYITRCFLNLPDFKSCIAQILERGRRFSNISLAARDNIAKAGQAFIRPGQTVLTHGWSRAVSSLLLKAAEQTDFEIIILEGRPDASGAKAAKVYQNAGIPTTVVLDSAMAYVMERIDLVIVGAEGVVENGGIVNKIGTYALALAAKELAKPFYVAAEVRGSFMFGHHFCVSWVTMLTHSFFFVFSCNFT